MHPGVLTPLLRGEAEIVGIYPKNIVGGPDRPVERGVPVVEVRLQRGFRSDHTRLYRLLFSITVGEPQAEKQDGQHVGYGNK